MAQYEILDIGIILKNYKHVLITRFNIPVSNWSKDKNNKSVLDDQWIKNRVEIFERFCYPSVMGSSNKDFIWLVGFDINSSTFLKNKINEYKNNNIFTPIFCEEMEQFIPKCKDYIYSQYQGLEKIVSTRLDNDDCIHKDFIKTIQENISDSTSEVINLSNGYQLTLGETNCLRVDRRRSNHFTTYSEPFDDFKTIYFNDHTKLKNEKRYKNIKTRRLWIEVVHGDNMCNDTRYKSFFTNRIRFEDFCVNVVDVPNLWICFYRNIFVLIRNILDKIIKPVKIILNRVVKINQKR